MNEALMELARAAGAPEEMLEDLWFNIFCQRFADVLLCELEKEVDEQEV